MDRPPLDIFRRRLAVNGRAKHVEHPRNNFLAYRYLKRFAGVFDPHSSCQARSGRQGNASHTTGVELSHDFDDDLAFRTSVENGEYRRQTTVKSHIDDATTHRDDRSKIRRVRFIP